MGRDLTTPELVEAIEKESRGFECPKCHTHLQFMVRVSVIGVRESMTAEEYVARRPGETPPKNMLSSAEQQVIEEARAAGVLDAFAAAVKVKTPPVPANVEKFFIFFLNTATKMKAPQFAVRMCLPDDEAAGDLEMWSSQGVVAVTSDGVFKTFLPKWIVDGKPNPKLEMQGGKPRVVPADTSLKVWVRTRNGYVVGRGLLFNELRGRAAGDFAKATGNY